MAYAVLCTVVLVQLLSWMALVRSAGDALPPYVHQCSRSDPEVQSCYVEAIMHIRPWLAKGIPEISVPSTEPFRLDELSLSLTKGRGGYRITLRDMDVTGVSTFSVRSFSLDPAGDGGFTLEVVIPELRLVADYRSSGTLVIIPASGRGTLHGVLGGVRALLRGSTTLRGDSDYLQVTRLGVDLKVKDVDLRIERVPGGNLIITQATNLVLRTSGRQVLDAMLPDLRGRLAEVFLDIANGILGKVPVSYLVRE